MKASMVHIHPISTAYILLFLLRLVNIYLCVISEKTHVSFSNMDRNKLICIASESTFLSFGAHMKILNDLNLQLVFCQNLFYILST